MNIKKRVFSGNRIVDEFVSTWDTTKSGTTANNQIALPLMPEGSYSFRVFEDGKFLKSITAYDDNVITFDTPGVKTINCVGRLVGFKFNDEKDKNKILQVDQFGKNFDPLNGSGFFHGCQNLTHIAEDLDFSNITDLSRCFNGTKKFSQDLNWFDVSNVTKMGSMFQSSNFNGDISNWDVGKVTNMVYMFFASNFNGDLSTWNVSSVTNMAAIFFGSNFNKDISNWDVSNVTNMYAMLRETPFNGDLSTWNVSSVTNMQGMFFSSNFNGDLSSWDVSNVTNMKEIFAGRSQFNQDLSNWNFQSVDNFGGFIIYPTESGKLYDYYDGLLIALNNTAKNNKTISVEGKYTKVGEPARNNLINNKGWTINDLGRQNN